MQTKNRKILINICLIGIFSALSFVGVLINIPIPSPLGKPMIHLGNLVVVVVSLLFGGIIGGASGSIGMGLYDILNGYDIWSISRTIILKLAIGLIVGFIYHKIIKKQMKKPLFVLFITGAFLTLLGTTFLTLAITNNGSFTIEAINKTVTITWPVYVFSLIIGLFLLFVGLLANKFSLKLQAAAIATSVAICVNICGEFIYKVLKQMILGGSNFIHSVYLGFASIPSTLINGGITLFIILLIFIPIEQAVMKNIKR